MRPLDPLPSALLAKTWDVPTVGKVAMVGKSPSLLNEIDRDWPSGRLNSDYHIEWRWLDITAKKAETFMLVEESGKPVAIWCSAKRRPIKLKEGRFYRLDFMEAAPDLRGGDFGLFLISVISARAVELGACGVVLQTWDCALRRYYTDLGAVCSAPTGWNIPANLIPFTIETTLLKTLSVYIKGFENG